MIEPKDYCVSLEMAQRPELHAAMAAAGCAVGPGQPRFGWVPSLDGWFIHENAKNFITCRPAYSLGELWCAAGRPRVVGTPDELAELVIALHKEAQHD